MAKASRRTVLVVEDEMLIRILATDSLRESGFTVLEAGNATEALRILDERDDVDVLVTDISMPGPIDGMALAELMRDRRPDLGLIITSGRGELDPADLPNTSLYLAKPYLPRQLAAAVECQTLH